MSLREDKKARTRHALHDAALALFDASGFDAVTIEAIAARAQVSARTFFRYFDSKEAVLFCDWREDLRDLTASFQAQDEALSLGAVLRQVALEWAARYEPERARYVRLHALIDRSPSAGVYERSVLRPQLEAALSALIAQRLGVETAHDLRPEVYAASLVAAMWVAKRRWLAQGEALREQVRLALDALGQLGHA